MKNFGKIVSLILSAVMIFSCMMTVSAQSEGLAAADIIMGDLNYDGKITTLDAKKGLKVIAGLENGTFDENTYDTNRDGRLTTADVKNLLRHIAGLTPLETGFGKDRRPNVLNVFKGGSYEVKVIEEGIAVEAVICDNTNFSTSIPESELRLMLGDDYSPELINAMFGFFPDRIIAIGTDYYITGYNFYAPDVKCAMYVSELFAALGLSAEELDLASMLTQEMGGFASLEFDEILEYTNDDGKKCLALTDYKGADFITVNVDSQGTLISIDTGTVKGGKMYISSSSEFSSITSKIDRSIFDLSQFTMIE